MTGVIPSLGRMPSLGKLATHGRPDNWTTLGRIQSNMVIDFTSATISDTLAARGFTFTRSGATATRVNSYGVLETVAANALRIDHDPTTLACLGGLFEEAGTNAIRNSTMVGAAAGSPGTLPTNWIFTTQSGVTASVVATGTENGIAYVECRFVGTSSAEGDLRVQFEGHIQVAASSGQAWTESAYLALANGSVPSGRTFNISITERNSGGSIIVANQSTNIATSLTSTLRRFSFSVASTNASTAFVHPYFVCFIGVGAVVDFTIRIGAPQLEQKAFATSYIPTSTAAVTRNADALRCSALGAWFLQSAGSLVARARSNSGVGARVLMEFGTSGANLDRYGLLVAATSAIQASGVTGGVANNATTANAITTGSNFVAAGAYDASGKAAVLNGGSVAVSATGIPLSAYSIFDIGRATWGGAYFNGVIQMVAYYPRRLSDAELQSITT